MNFDDAREFALSLRGATVDLFADTWLSFRVGGKWFMLAQIDAPEPRVAVKLPPDEGLAAREEYQGVTAAYHMNKVHWNDLYLEQLESETVRHFIRRSYETVFTGLPKGLQSSL